MRHHYRAGFEWYDTDLDEGTALLHRLLAGRGAARPAPDPRPFADAGARPPSTTTSTPRSALEALDDLASAILSGGDDTDAPAELVGLARLVGVDLTVAARTG